MTSGPGLSPSCAQLNWRQVHADSVLCCPIQVPETDEQAVLPYIPSLYQEDGSLTSTYWSDPQYLMPGLQILALVLATVMEKKVKYSKSYLYVVGRTLPSWYRSESSVSVSFILASYIVISQRQAVTSLASTKLEPQFGPSAGNPSANLNSQWIFIPFSPVSYVSPIHRGYSNSRLVAKYLPATPQRSCRGSFSLANSRPIDKIYSNQDKSSEPGIVYLVRHCCATEGILQSCPCPTIGGYC